VKAAYFVADPQTQTTLFSVYLNEQNNYMRKSTRVYVVTHFILLTV